MTVERFFAPCPRGLEAALADELRALGATVTGVPSGGVRFDGDAALGMAANLHSRIASRVLQQVADGAYRTEDDLYRLARETEWERWHAPLATLRVDTSAVSAPLRSLRFATLRVKDGVVDRLRERFGERPSIERQRPQRRIHAFLDAGRCTLYLDWSGEALFKRGWRRDDGDAPMKENLAAGLLAIAGWRPGEPLLDPFCGSGTIVVEAAMIAAGVPPGARRRFAFERMRDFDRAAWDRMRTLRPRPAPGAPSIFGSDVSEAAIAAARANLGRCGVDAGWVALRQLDHDVLTIQETGRANAAESDEAVLAFAAAENRVLVTLNRRHFIRLHNQGAAQAGIVVCTFDPDFVALTERVHAALAAEVDEGGFLLRVNRL